MATNDEDVEDRGQDAEKGPSKPSEGHSEGMNDMDTDGDNVDILSSRMSDAVDDALDDFNKKITEIRKKRDAGKNAALKLKTM